MRQRDTHRQIETGTDRQTDRQTETRRKTHPSWVVELKHKLAPRRAYRIRCTGGTEDTSGGTALTKHKPLFHPQTINPRALTPHTFSFSGSPLTADVPVERSQDRSANNV